MLRVHVPRQHGLQPGQLNLLKFVDVETGDVDIEGYRHAVRLWTIVLEISVLMAQFPSKEIARLSYDFRTLGLGYANLGTVLMMRGMPYDSDEARAFTSALTAIMTGESLRDLGRDGAASSVRSRATRRTSGTCCA